ncbi:hypothetical protein CUMW_111110 [Citrus unshiu]|nr:hypothetical protein CUMW_111110 [Citrus unshiu]
MSMSTTAADITKKDIILAIKHPCFSSSNNLSSFSFQQEMGSGQWIMEKRSSLRNDSFSRDNDNVPETGCLSIIVLGASGDLAKKKTFPALFNLYRQGFLQSNEVHIFGYARTKISDDELRNRIRGYLINDKSAPGQSEQVSEFLQLIKYVSGSYDTEEGFQLLDKEISAHESSKNSLEGSSRRLFYFALPPSVYPSVSRMIKKCCMNRSDLGGWTRIVVEKPFGKDLDSSEKLSAQIGELFEEPQIYRIDHYLGKELVQNLLVLRFANRMFLPLWNRDNIDNVQILELKVVEDILMNMGMPYKCVPIFCALPQNEESCLWIHMVRENNTDMKKLFGGIIQKNTHKYPEQEFMWVLCLVAMEKPVSLKPEHIRDEKVKVLQSVLPIKDEEVVLGQYDGYRDDPTVPDHSNTPTFATAVLRIHNERWEGVPFILKAGKALNSRKAEIRVQFKDVPEIRLGVYWRCNAPTSVVMEDPLYAEQELAFVE